MCSAWKFLIISVHPCISSTPHSFDSPWSLLSVVIQQGRTAEAEAEFERLLGVSEAKFAMSQLSKVDRGEDTDTVKFSELLHGHHSKGI